MNIFIDERNPSWSTQPALTWTATIFLMLSGCQWLPSASPVSAPHSLTESTAASTPVFRAWNPPGLVVTDVFVGNADAFGGLRSIPLKRIAFETPGLPLRLAVERAFGAVQLSDISAKVQSTGDPWSHIAVMRKQGLLTEYAPLPLVMRFPLGDRSILDNDVVGLIQWGAINELVAPVASDPVTVQISGLVNQPGSVTLEPIDREVFQAIRNRAGGFQTSGNLTPSNVIVITRFTPKGLVKFHLPVVTNDDEFAIDDFFGEFIDFFLRDGDLVEVTRMEWLPGVLRGRMDRANAPVIAGAKREQRHRAHQSTGPSAMLPAFLRSRQIR